MSLRHEHNFIHLCWLLTQLLLHVKEAEIDVTLLPCRVTCINTIKTNHEEQDLKEDETGKMVRGDANTTRGGGRRREDGAPEGKPQRKMEEQRWDEVCRWRNSEETV